MTQGLKLQAVGRKDRADSQYYFTCPKIPVSVDLSQAVIFVYPWERNGEVGADIVFKLYEEGVGSNKQADYDDDDEY